MSADVLLAGFAFTGYRSFGTEELQRIGPMSKVHLLAGPNNSGKTNVPTVAQQALPAFRDRKPFAPNDTDIPLAPLTYRRRGRRRDETRGDRARSGAGGLGGP